MRFLYVEPNSPEAKERLRLEAMFDQFWSTFRDRAGEQASWMKGGGPFAEFIHKALPIAGGGGAESVEWEMGPAPNGEFKLCFSIAGELPKRAMCDRLVEMAPVIPGWSFSGYRQPEPASVATQLLEGRRGQPLPNARFRLKPMERRRILTLECFVDADDEPSNVERGSAMILAEILIGEEDFERWVGPIEVLPLRRRGLLRRRESAPADAVSMEELRQHALAQIARLRASMPQRPRFQFTDQDWADANELDLSRRKPLAPGQEPPGVSYRMEPKELSAEHGFPHTSDLLAAIARDAVLYSATHGPAFNSQQHSLFDERFCFVKVERDAFIEEVADRQTLEDQIDERLKAAGVGCCWAGGTGVRFGYFELALINVQAAIPLLRELCAGAKRGWLLFHDVSLEDEWIDLVDSSGPPPQFPRQENV